MSGFVWVDISGLQRAGLIYGDKIWGSKDVENFFNKWEIDAFSKKIILLQLNQNDIQTWEQENV